MSGLKLRKHKNSLGTTYSTQKSMATKTRTAARIADFSSCIQNIFFIWPQFYTLLVYRPTLLFTLTSKIQSSSHFQPKKVYIAKIDNFSADSANSTKGSFFYYVDQNLPFFD